MINIRICRQWLTSAPEHRNWCCKPTDLICIERNLLTVFFEWLVLNTQSGSKISYFRSDKLTCIAANFPIRFSATIPGCRSFIFAILPIVDHFLVGDVRGTAPHIRLFVNCGTHAWSAIYIRYSYCTKAHLHKKSTTRGRFATDSATNSSRLKGKSNITTH